MSKSLVVLLSLAATAAMSQPVMAAPIPVVQDEREALKAELEKKLETVDTKDAEALFEVAMWAEANGLKTDAKRTLRKVIRADKDHAEARKLLGYVQVDGKWVTEREAERLKKKAEEAEKEAMGLKKWKDGEWYPAEKVEKMEKGLFPVDVNGEEVWVTEREKGFIEEGLVPYKGQWIKAEDKAKIDEGLFPVEGKWLSEAEADEYHASLETPWVIDSDHSVLTTTCNRAFGEKALINARRAIERTYQLLDLEMPEEFGKVELILVRTVDDYNVVGNQAQDDNDATMSSTYGCFSFQNPESLTHMGVALYSVIDESNPEANDNYSLFLVRHAASEAAVRNITFEEEIPRWLISGVATYCERYWDPFNSNGSARLAAWSAENLQREGGLRNLKSFFEPFTISRQTLLQSGMVVSFLHHGQLPDSVKEQWTKVKELMRAEKQKGLAKEFLKLESILAKDGQKAFEAYAESVASSS